MDEPKREIMDSETDPSSEVRRVILPEDATNADRQREIATQQAQGWRGPIELTQVYLERVRPDAVPRVLLFSRPKER